MEIKLIKPLRSGFRVTLIIKVEKPNAMHNARRWKQFSIMALALGHHRLGGIRSGI